MGIFVEIKWTRLKLDFRTRYSPHIYYLTSAKFPDVPRPFPLNRQPPSPSVSVLRVTTFIVMHPSLKIRDILDEIFSWLPLSELVTTVVIHSAWFEASVPLLWRDVPLQYVLATLAPLIPEKTNSSELVRLDSLTHLHHQYTNEIQTFASFEEHPPQGWQRFLFYARYVQVLDDTPGECAGALEAVIKCQHYLDLIKRQDRQYLFPICRSLMWLAFRPPQSVDLSKVIPPTLEILVLDVWDLGYTLFDGLCEAFINHLTSLRSLRFTFIGHPDGDLKYNISLNQLLTTFASTLYCIELSARVCTPDTMDLLLKMQNLTSLSISPPRTTSRLPSNKRPPHYVECNGRRGLMSLEVLIFGFEVPLSCFQRLFEQSMFPALTHLDWSDDDLLQSEVNVKSVIWNIGRACPELQYLNLGWSRLPDVESLPVVPWSVVRPLLGCRRLIHLFLCCCEVDMSFENYVELLARPKDSTWLSLEVFNQTALPLKDMLLAMAKYCPQVEHLVINAGLDEPHPDSVVFFPETEEMKMSVLPMLTSLDFLHSDFSPTTVRYVAMLLSRFCPKVLFPRRTTSH